MSSPIKDVANSSSNSFSTNHSKGNAGRKGGQGKS